MLQLHHHKLDYPVLATLQQCIMTPNVFIAALVACSILVAISGQEVVTAPNFNGRSHLPQETDCAPRRITNFICPDSAALSRLREAASRTVVRELQVKNVDGDLKLMKNFTEHLTVLDLTSSRATAITGSQNFPHLRTLILTGNAPFNITSLLKMGRISSLTSLHLSGINIGPSAALQQVLGKLPKLQTLNMANCGLTVLDYYLFSGLPNLRFLNISGNPLRSVQFHAKVLYPLEELSMSNCSLEEVIVEPFEDSLILPTTKSLYLLNLSFNKLAEIDPRLVYAMAERGTLDLTGNPLRTASCALFPLHFFHDALLRGPGGVVGAAQVLDSFSAANVTYCSWQMCPALCICVPSNRTVNCMSAGLTAVPPFGPSEAEVLNLDKNNISSLAGLGRNVWTTLQYLSVQNNELTSLSVPGNVPPELRHLNVKGNRISSISAEDCPLLASLYSLNVTENHLVDINAFRCGYLSLTNLDVSKNYIKILSPLDLASLPYLQFLNLSFNSISVLSKTTLDKVPSLKLLDVSWNYLTMIVTRQYDLLPYSSRTHRTLERILLNHNLLSNLEDLQKLGLSSTNSLNIDENPWRCSCDSNLQRSLLPTLLNGQCHNSTTLVSDFINNMDTICSQEPENKRGSVPTTNDLWNLWACGVMVIGAIVVACCACMVGHLSNVCSTLSRRPAEPEVPNNNTMFILHHWDNIGMVNDVLRPYLQSVAPKVPLLYCENMDLLGRPLREAFQPYLKRIGKVLVVVSESSFEDTSFRKLLSQCNCEHLRSNHFLMMALLMEDAPSVRVLADDKHFHFLVNDRPYVLYADGDFMLRIVQFLHPGGAPPEILNISDSRCW